MSEPNGETTLLTPLPVAKGVELILGLVSLAVVVAASSYCGLLVKRRRISSDWFGVLGLLLAVGAYVGLAYRLATASVIGANIGAGLLLLLCPLPIALLVLGVVRAIRLVRR